MICVSLTFIPRSMEWFLNKGRISGITKSSIVKSFLGLDFLFTNVVNNHVSTAIAEPTKIPIKNSHPNLSRRF